VKLEIWRKGSAQEIDARLGGLKDKSVDVASNSDSAAKGGKLGLSLRPLQPQEQRASGLENGLVVENVGGAAARAGVESGDVLLAVNGTPVRNIEQVREAVSKSSKSVALLIQRGEDKIFVPVRIG
jgi:serine protease Do